MVKKELKLDLFTPFGSVQNCILVEHHRSNPTLPSPFRSPRSRQPFRRWTPKSQPSRPAKAEQRGSSNGLRCVTVSAAFGPAASRSSSLKPPISRFTSDSRGFIAPFGLFDVLNLLLLAEAWLRHPPCSIS